MAMSMIEMNLVSEIEHPDGYYYRATIESGVAGLCRLNVDCCEINKDESKNSQGMDLTAAECRALAQMLMASASILDAEITDI